LGQEKLQVKFEEDKIIANAAATFSCLARIVNALLVQQGAGVPQAPGLRQEIGNAITLIMMCKHEQKGTRTERDIGDGAADGGADPARGANAPGRRPEVAPSVPTGGSPPVRGERKPTVPHQGIGQKKGLKPTVIVGNIRGEVARATAPISDADGPAGPTAGLEHLIPKV
jgi:hypothetical protein